MSFSVPGGPFSGPGAFKNEPGMKNRVGWTPGGVRGPVLSGFWSGGEGSPLGAPNIGAPRGAERQAPAPPASISDTISGRKISQSTADQSPGPKSAQNGSPDPSRGPSDAVFHPGFVFEGPGAQKRPPEAENGEKPKSYIFFFLGRGPDAAAAAGRGRARLP